jgi:hypothetical protein
MPTDTELEIRLRRDLRARQATAAPAPADLADRVRRRHRSQRRAQALAAVAAVAVVAGFAGAATLVTRIQAGPAPDTADRQSFAPEDGILGWSTRGSLAGDEEWLDGLRRLDWEPSSDQSGEITVPAVADRHVAYAGEVPDVAAVTGEILDGTPDGTVALVVGEADGRVVAAWFTGDPAATPEQMQLAAPPQPVAPTAPLAYLGPAGPTAPTIARVVVAAPDATLERSTTPIVHADGTETVPYVPLPGTDGTFADLLHPSVAQTREVRSRPSDGQPAQIVPVVVALEDPDFRQVRPGEQLTEQSVLGEEIDRIMSRYALQGGGPDPNPRTLTTGDAADGHRAALVGLTFPSGATGAWLVDYTLVRDGWRSSVGRLPHAPAGTPLEERLIGVPAGEDRIALHAPPGAVRAEVLSAEGAVLGTVDLADGGYVGTVPGRSFAPSTDGAATIRALDSAGRTVAEGAIDRVVDE